jgi:hypothetical protein
VDDKQVFRVVENRKFQRFVSCLNKLYRMPSRRTDVRGIEDRYAVARRDFCNIVDGIPGQVALSYDGWSSRIMRGYFVMTLHWIDERWIHRSSVLEFKLFLSPHNMHTTSALIKRILKEFNLATKIRTSTTDSGSEMPPAMKIVKEVLNKDFNLFLDDDFHIRWVCHIINPAVVDCEALFLTKMWEMLKMTRNAQRMREAFKEVQISLAMQTSKSVPGLDVDNCWNSMFQND